MQLTLKVPVGTKEMARMMKMNDVEVSFFYYLDELRGIIEDYNYGLYHKNIFIERLETLATKCKAEGLTIYADGIRALEKTIQYSY